MGTSQEKAQQARKNDKMTNCENKNFNKLSFILSQKMLGTY